MRTPEPDPRGLEDRLRSHYVGKADELRLPGLEWEDVAQSGKHRNGGGGSNRPVSTWLVAASVAALVAGATIGGAVVLRSRDDDPSTGSATSAVTLPATVPPTTNPPETNPPATSIPSAVTAPPTTAPGGSQVIAPVANALTCPDESTPPTAPSEGWPNDWRSPGLPLPASLDGFCPVEHWVETSYGQATGPPFTVWTDCGSCAEPSVAVAFAVGVPFIADAELDRQPVAVDVRGRAGHYYAPSQDAPRFRLYTVDDAGASIVLTGWGLEQDQAVQALSEVMSAITPSLESGASGATGATTPTSPLGLQEVYSGPIGRYSATATPFDRMFGVQYVSGSGDGLSYAVQRYGPEFGAVTTPAAAWLFAWPNARLVTVGETTAVAFDAQPSRWSTALQESGVIVPLDDHTVVFFEHDAADPMTPEELAAIELTPAAVDDPRWEEIAWESGGYNSIG